MKGRCDMLHKCDVKIGTAYKVRVSGDLVPVRITDRHPIKGWIGRNELTGRSVRIRTAMKLRRVVADEEVTSAQERRRIQKGV